MVAAPRGSGRTRACASGLRDVLAVDELLEFRAEILGFVEEPFQGHKQLAPCTQPNHNAIALLLNYF